jgi:hypothetical protein
MDSIYPTQTHRQFPKYLNSIIEIEIFHPYVLGDVIEFNSER